MSFLQIDAVTKIFQLGKDRITALDDISFSLGGEEFGALIGPSGCGKSTLLRLIADIFPPSQGSIRIGGKPPASARREHLIGFVFQEASLLPWRTVLQNVKLPLEIVGRKNVDHGAPPEKLVELVGLADFKNAKPGQLSGGMQQRASIARALALRPRILLLDEPFGALDEITRQRMNLELLRIWTESQTAALLVTHSIQEAVFMADCVFVLSSHPGRLAKIVKVDLPRPRRLSMLRSKEFFDTVNIVRDALFSDEAAYLREVDNSDAGNDE
jgi:NitT/TauT family transport system ATP-binding protein